MKKGSRKFTREFLIEQLVSANCQPYTMANRLQLPHPNIYYHLKKHNIDTYLAKSLINKGFSKQVISERLILDK